MPTSADQTDAIRASLALWLHLTVNPAFTQWSTNTQAPGKPRGWYSPDSDLPLNLAALEDGQRGAIADMLEAIGAMDLPNGTVTTMGGAFSAVQKAFHTVMTAQTAVVQNPPYLPGSPSCPKDVSFISELTLAYPDPESSSVEEPSGTAA